MVESNYDRKMAKRNKLKIEAAELWLLGYKLKVEGSSLWLEYHKMVADGRSRYECDKLFNEGLDLNMKANEIFVVASEKEKMAGERWGEAVETTRKIDQQ